MYNDKFLLTILQPSTTSHGDKQVTSFCSIGIGLRRTFQSLDWLLFIVECSWGRVTKQEMIVIKRLVVTSEQWDIQDVNVESAVLYLAWIVVDLSIDCAILCIHFICVLVHKHMHTPSV